MCQAEAGRLQSIYFYLLGEEELAAWLHQSLAMFQTLPQTPTLQVGGLEVATLDPASTPWCTILGRLK